MESTNQTQKSPLLTKNFLCSKGFEEIDGFLVKRIEQENRTHKFYIGEQQELGTYLEYFINNHLQVSGYWLDEADFCTEFQF